MNNFTYVIGVDVGGTNTDAVLLRIQSDNAPIVVTWTKSVTTPDVSTGLITALEKVYSQGKEKCGMDLVVSAIMLGTTHFVNAVLQRKGLAKVCTIRLCGLATHSLKPMTHWPLDLREQVDPNLTYRLGLGCEIFY
ncbi:unnamed protein product, partial [Didymodactylos carnosus]